MRTLRRLLTLACILLSCVLSTRAQVVTTNYSSRTTFGYTTSGLYDAHDPYTIGTTDWLASLKPLQPTNLARGGTANFLNVLQATFPNTSGWTFAAAANDLSQGSLVVRTYDVQGTPARVGAEFDVQYIPGANDPTANVHWIQVVTDNHNLTTNPGHGNPENVVDNPFSPGGRSPYYDDGGAANGRNFYDFPWRGDANMSHDWYAELFLVTGPAAGTPGAVTIYNGVGWGWTNAAVVPEPHEWAVILVMGAFVGILIVRKRFQSRSVHSL